MDFTSSVSDVDAVTKKITVSIPVEMVKKQFNTVISRYAKSAKIKGFREGKAPKEMVERLYGDKARADVANDLISTALDKVYKDNALTVVGTPQIDLTSFTDDKPIEFNANVSIYPKPTVTGFDKFTVEVSKREVKDEDVDKVVEYLRKSRSTVKPLEGRTTLQKGDVARAEIIVIEGGAGEGKPEPAHFCLGEGHLPAEVEAAIEGMAIGETREAQTKADEKDAGEIARVFKVKLESLFERVLPEFDDAFAKTIEPAVATVLELKIKIRERLQKEKAEEEHGDVHAAIIEQLLKANEFAVPQILVDDEIRQVLVKYGYVDPKSEINEAVLEGARKELGEAALRRVKAAIILDRIAEEVGTKLEKEDLDEQFHAISHQLKVSVDEAKNRVLSNRGWAASVVSDALRRKVLEDLHSKATVNYKS